MPCGQENLSPKELDEMLKTLGPDGKAVPMPSGPFKDEPSKISFFDKGGLPDALDESGEDTNKPFVRDLTIDELETLIEKAVRRVLQGEDIRKEYARLQAEKK